MSNFNDLNPALSGLGRTRNNNNSSRHSSGLSKPRFSKVRRQAKSHNIKPPKTPDSLSGQTAYNPFHYQGSFTTSPAPQENFVFGHSVSNLMQNLNIKETHSTFDDELPTLLTDKLTINGNRDSSSTSNVIHESMEKLNISEKGTFTPKGQPLDYVGEKILSDELIRKLNVGRIDTDESLNPTVDTSEFKFSSNKESQRTGFMEFKTPDSKVNLFPKRDNVSDTRGRRKGSSSKQPVKVQLNVRHEYPFPHVSNSEASESAYSPMDISPYEETRDDKVLNLDESHDTPRNDALEAELVSLTEKMEINDEVNNFQTKDEVVDESISGGADNESFKTAAEDMETSGDGTFMTASETEVTSRFKPNDSGFTFSASTSSGVQGQVSSTPKRINRKNKFGQDPFIIIPNASTLKSLQQPSPLTGLRSHLDHPLTRSPKPVIEKPRDVSNVAQEVCEKWRLKGNNAYKNGDLSRAEEAYTQGIDSVPKTETSRNCIRALMLCYSNRAATRMALGRMREAIADCIMASSIDSNFLKVQVRAGNCYLSLGEIEEASVYFKKCLQSGNDVCVDRKIIVEASEGLQKAQRLSEAMHEAGRHMQLRTSTDVEKALEIIEESLLISSYSEKLLAMKGEALLMLDKYETAIKFCEETVDLAAKNSLPEDINFRIWRCHLILKSYFQMGKLEDAIASLEKQGQLLESSIPLAATIRELLRLKTSGNEAFQSGRHTEAVEYYTSALSCNVESRPFTSVCFCNRAAAYKALGQYSDAIADCSLAIALDQNYSKAISRRASLFEMIRDYGQAANDMQRYVNILTKSSSSTSLGNDIRQARLRLSELEEKSRKETSLDMYLVLGVVPTCTASDIRKAYRKAALKHHPDKAGQSLTRNETKDERLWKEIGEEVRRDTDKLFKMIGEAYAMLSDPEKRSQYDIEEEMRNVQKKRDGSGGVSTSGGGGDMDASFPFNSNRRNWRDVWSSRRDTSAAPRWFDPNRSNRYPL